MATENMIKADSFLEEYNMVLALEPEVCLEKNEQDFSEDFKKIFNLTNLSIKMFASSYYKNGTYLEPSDIDQIKSSLNNYANKDEKVCEFKQQLINDLTEFQNQIRAKHLQQMVEITKQQQEYENRIVALESEKNKLVRARLAKMAWPYDAKTKEYDNKIAMLQAKVEQFAQKAANIKAMRPAANEKDILIYQMQLKEKYAA